jgi:glycosyltransferase involved in cell wall biosynthesis
VDFQAGITLILEAMAMSKAVIVSDSRGLPAVVRGPTWFEGKEDWSVDDPEVSGSNGIRVPPYDAGAMRSAIQFLLRNPSIADEIGRNGRRMAKQEFSIEAFAQRFAGAIVGAARPGMEEPRHAVHV